MLFTALGLAPELQQAIDACDYSEMTPVQEQAIVPARRGKDLLVSAQTGTGKTAAFALPMLQQLLDNPRDTESASPRGLILCPTRELAEQLAQNIREYAQFTELSVVAVFGGMKMAGQASKLKRGVDILIATPGRLTEHMTEGNVNLKACEFVVLDEADRMLDMGFIDSVQQLLQHTPKNKQTLLFSATISAAVNELAHKILKNFQEIRVSKQNSTAVTVAHVVYPVEERRKVDLFLELLEEYNWYQVLVFTSTKEQADRLLASLQQKGVNAEVCHGDRSQGARRRAIANFKAGDTQVLIATEVAARGLDIQGLEYVINFNLPYLAEDYVHRIGRTGRAGTKGYAISFVSREEERALEAIQRLIGSKVQRIKQAGYEVSNRDTLLKAVARSPRLARSNKSAQPQNAGVHKGKKPAGANKTGSKNKR
jgi:ATP-dependent RNA helicase RhlE